MTNTRMFPVALLGAALLSLSACGGSDADAGAAPAPIAATSAAPAPAATSAAPDAPAAADASDDKKICTSVDAAGEAMKKEMIAAMMQDTEDLTPVKEAVTTFADDSAKAAAGSSSDVGTAALKLAEVGTGVAASANPLESMEADNFEKAYDALIKACKTAGVTLKN